jgi:hypothetical protein
MQRLTEILGFTCKLRTAGKHTRYVIFKILLYIAWWFSFILINHYGVILIYNVCFFIQGVQKSSKLLKKRIVRI